MMLSIFRKGVKKKRLNCMLQHGLIGISKLQSSSSIMMKTT